MVLRGRGRQEGAVPKNRRYWLTTDSDMTYTVFVGSEPPRVDRLSGHARWMGGRDCRMLFVSVGEPYLFADQFGVVMDALNCVELSDVQIRSMGAAPLPQVHPQPVVAEAACSGPGPGWPRFVERGNGQFIPFAELRAGAWFLWRDPDTNQDVPCAKVDEVMCVAFEQGDVLMADVEPGELIIPITPELTYQRTLAPRDPRTN